MIREFLQVTVIGLLILFGVWMLLNAYAVARKWNDPEAFRDESDD